MENFDIRFPDGVLLGEQIDRRLARLDVERTKI